MRKWLLRWLGVKELRLWAFDVIIAKPTPKLGPVPPGSYEWQRSYLACAATPSEARWKLRKVYDIDLSGVEPMELTACMWAMNMLGDEVNLHKQPAFAQTTETRSSGSTKNISVNFTVMPPWTTTPPGADIIDDNPEPNA